MGFARQSLTALRRIGIVILIAITFLFGVVTTVYLSLRSPEVKIPDIVGKDRFEAERILGQADLNFRVRAVRPSNQVAANTVLFQLPHAGDVVKAGQTVAMDISRSTKEGEASEPAPGEKKVVDEKAATNANANDASAPKNDNENRPKRNKNTNKNANENANANTLNRNRNVNRLPNVNGARVDSNTPTLNANRPAGNANLNIGRPANQNENRRPATPRPSPPRQNNNR